VAPKGEAVKVFLLRCKGWATSKAESIKAFLRRHKGWLTVLGGGGDIGNLRYEGYSSG
jgi:hypothetical protein